MVLKASWKKQGKHSWKHFQFSKAFLVIDKTGEGCEDEMGMRTSVQNALHTLEEFHMVNLLFSFPFFFLFGTDGAIKINWWNLSGLGIDVDPAGLVYVTATGW